MMERDELVGTLELMRHVFSGMESTGELAAKHKPSETISKVIALLTSDATRIAELEAALRNLVNAKALSGVRALVAGWNGEGRPEGPFNERHPNRLGATLPKTNCGAVYALDEAMQAARKALEDAS